MILIWLIDWLIVSAGLGQNAAELPRGRTVPSGAGADVRRPPRHKPAIRRTDDKRQVDGVINSFIHSFIYLFIYLVICSFIHSFIYSFILNLVWPSCILDRRRLRAWPMRPWWKCTNPWTQCQQRVTRRNSLELSGRYRSTLEFSGR